MKIKSTYLGVEFDIPMKETESAGEPVTIIPHKVLKDLVYNSEEAKKLNLQCRNTPIATEPKHYVFLCAMSDNAGRRVEAIGESQESTTLTEIAKAYPVTMAFNRAFDAAVIDFFGFPRKVYSDLQIDEGAPSNERPVKAAEQPKPSSKPAAGSKKAPEPPAKDMDGDTPEAPATKGKASENEKPFPPADNKPAQGTTKAAKEAAEPVKKEAAAGETAAKETAEGETATEAAPKDEFDETIIVVGSMKRAGLSVRECYKQKPDAIRWIAYTLAGKSELYQSQKSVCQRFLQSIGDTEGEMGNAS